MQKPEPGEYNPYMQKYIDLIGEGDILQIIDSNTSELIKLFDSIPAEKHNYRYAEGKWTIKEVLMHIVDTERVMSYRAFVAGRCDDKTVLHYMDEDAYAANVDVTDRSMEDLLEEFQFVRGATLKLFRNLNTEQLTFKANNMEHKLTARAMAYIIPGHARHHIHVLKERYLSA